MTPAERAEIDYVAQPWRRKSPNNDALRLRRAEAIRLRIQGMSFREIARTLGIDGHAAFNDVRLTIAAEVSAAVDELRQVEDLRIKAIIERANEVLAAAGNTELALKALDRILRASQSLRQLWGMDLPVKVDVTMHEVDEADRELQEMILEAKAANAVVEQAIIEAGGGDRPAG